MDEDQQKDQTDTEYVESTSYLLDPPKEASIKINFITITPNSVAGSKIRVGKIFKEFALVIKGSNKRPCHFAFPNADVAAQRISQWLRITPHTQMRCQTELNHTD